MNVHHSRERDPASGDSDPASPLSDAHRETLVDRLEAVAEPSSSVDHLLEHLTGARAAARMSVVDWTLPLVRTDGGVTLRVTRPDGAAAYLGFVGDEFRATPWGTGAEGTAGREAATVAPREWFPEDARVDPLPVEATPFGD